MLIRYSIFGVCALAMLAGLAFGYRAMTRPQATITIEWTTASELNTAGFNLYRSEAREGPFTRVNPDIIPPAPDPLVGGAYVFTDTTVQAGRIYYYQLEDVETSGVTTRHDPIEVKAEWSASRGMLVAVALFGAGLVGLVATLSSRRLRSSASAPMP